MSTLLLSPYTLLRVEPDQLKQLRSGGKLTQLVGSATSTAWEYVQSGLTPGQQQWMIVRPVRGSETGLWSDPATRVANVQPRRHEMASRVGCHAVGFASAYVAALVSACPRKAEGMAPVREHECISDSI